MDQYSKLQADTYLEILNDELRGIKDLDKPYNLNWFIEIETQIEFIKNNTYQG